jgi:hypothetical protein
MSDIIGTGRQVCWPQVLAPGAKFARWEVGMPPCCPCIVHYSCRAPACKHPGVPSLLPPPPLAHSKCTVLLRQGMQDMDWCSVWYSVRTPLT